VLSGVSIREKTMTAYANGTHTIVGVLGTTETATLSPGATNVTFNLIGLVSTFDISSQPGATVIVNNTVDVANALVLNTNGGNITLATTVGALGATSVTIDDGGSFTLGSSLITSNLLSSGTLSFSAGGGTAVLGDSTSLLTLNLLDVFQPITGYTSTSDVIDDEGLTFADVSSYTITGSASDQTISLTASNGTSFTFAVSGSGFTDGSYTKTSGPLHLTVDASGGTEIAACFLSGTRIATPSGPALVENLKIGDQVLTIDGHILPVRWIGRNTVSARLADPLRAMPIRISAGALSDGIPQRDLLLSPEHALLIDGLLVQASALVNGLSITRESWMPETFVYYHVEVEHHSLIFAEGAAAETFVDNIARTVFDNWQEHLDLYGFDTSVPEMDYPRVHSSRQLPEDIQNRLLARTTSSSGTAHRNIGQTFEAPGMFTLQ
jgi:hypothetical protein